MRIAIFSVIYPAALPYLDDFLTSVANQTDNQFTLYLVNDGVADIETRIDRYGLNVILNSISGSPCAIRKKGIAWVLQHGPEGIVFADSDDCLMENRIDVSKNLLSNHDVVCNDLWAFSVANVESRPILSKRLTNGQKILATDLIHSNCMGLTNTAIRAGSISEHLSQIPDQVIAFDWTFFTICMQANREAVFTDDTATFYRQHQHSIGSPQLSSEEQILRGVKVKSDHYRFISRYTEQYASLSKKFERLHGQLRSNSEFKAKYCHAVKMQAPQSPLWWESIKTVGELGL